MCIACIVQDIIGVFTRRLLLVVSTSLQGGPEWPFAKCEAWACDSLRVATRSWGVFVYYINYMGVVL